MKQIDFSYAGGFPLTPEVLAFMQSAYVSTAAAPFFDAGQNPAIISGMVINTGAATLSPGWCLIAGELLYCAGGPLYAGTDNYVAVQNTKSSLTFENSLLREVYSTKTAVIVGEGSPGALALSTFQHWAVGLIANVRTRRKTFTGNLSHGTGTTTGSYTAKKDPFTGLVNLKGTFIVSNGPGVGAPDAPYYGLAAPEIPAEYRPLDTVPVSALVRHHSFTPPLESSSKDYIRQVNCTVSPDGYFSAGLLRATGAYTASFNITYPTW